MEVYKIMCCVEIVIKETSIFNYWTQWCHHLKLHGGEYRPNKGSTVVAGFSGSFAVFWRLFFLMFRQSLWLPSSGDSTLKCPKNPQQPLDPGRESLCEYKRQYLFSQDTAKLQNSLPQDIAMAPRLRGIRNARFPFHCCWNGSVSMIVHMASDVQSPKFNHLHLWLSYLSCRLEKRRESFCSKLGRAAGLQLLTTP